MAKKDTNITTKFTSDIKELKNGISQAKAQLKLANAEFKAATSAVDYAADSVDGYQTNIEHLSKILKSQNDILEGYQKELKLVEETQGKNSTAAIKLRTEIANQQAAVNKTAKEIAEYEKKLDDAANGADDLADATKEASKEAENAGEGFTVMKGVLADLASTAIKAVVSGLKDMANAAADAWAEWDDGADTIIKMTGATGAAAEGLTQSYNNVAKSVNADLGDISKAIGEVNTRFGVTGSDLEELATIFLKFSAITGEDVVSSVDDVQKAMSAFGLSVDNAEEFLDRLAATSQGTGISTSSLASGIVSNATAFQELGLSVDQAVELMGQLEMSGADAETVMAGLRKALKSSAAEGVSIGDALSQLQDEIDGASSSTEALNAVYDTFGKSGDQVYNAIKTGSLNFKKLAQATTSAGGTVENTFEATQDAPDKLALAMQGLKVDVAETANELMTEFEPELEEVITTLGDLASEAIPAIADFLRWVIDNGPTVAAVITGIGTAFAVFQIVGLITTLTTAFQTLFTALQAGEGIMTALNVAMNANPIGIIISLIAGLVAAFITLWNTSDEFRNFFIEMWEATKLMVADAWNAITGAITGAWTKIKNVWGKVGSFFTNLWDGIKSAASKAFDAIGGIIKAPINFLIDGINQVIEGLNGIAIPDWVPGIGGNSLNIPLIPRLEKGGILKKGEVGLLEGNGSEAVVPLDKNQKWIAAVARDMKAAGVGASKANSSSNTYNYNQYNNSPKALSRLEIYRQTQNLLDFAK